MNREDIALKILCARISDVNYLVATNNYIQKEIDNAYKIADMFLTHPSKTEKQHGKENRE